MEEQWRRDVRRKAHRSGCFMNVYGHLAAWLAASAALVAAILLVVRERVARRHLEAVNAAHAARQKALARDNVALAQKAALHEERSAWFGNLFDRIDQVMLVYGVAEGGMPDRFVAASQTACQTLGYGREQLLAMKPTEIEAGGLLPSIPVYSRSEIVTLSNEELAARESTLVRQRVARILDGRDRIYEVDFLTARGERLPMEVHAHAFESGGRPMIMLVAYDIARHRERERALVESEQRFRDFFANLPIGVVLYDSQRRLTNANLACLRMFAVPDEEQLRRFDLFDNVYMPEGTRQALKRGESDSYEATLDFDALRRSSFASSRRGKASFEIRIHNLGLDGEYRPRGYMAEIQDVTERREMETTLRAQEQQLRQSQKMQAIGTLSGGIAHDFNNILTPILGYSEMIVQSVPEENEVHGFAKEVLRASYRARDLVQQILTFSRQTEPQAKVMQVTPIAKEVLRLLQAALPPGVEARLAAKAARDIILADPTQIHQVLMNLCRNAVHAMSSGGVLEVRLDNFRIDRRSRSQPAQLGPGMYLRISVRDTGVGMEPAVMERIFEPFFTTRRKGEGTGMGLAVVHGIVSGLKGTISVESKVGEGSTFHVILPVVDRAEVDIGELAAPPLSDGESVLMVDDEPDITRLGLRMLRSLGYAPVALGDSREALRLFQLAPDRFDVVITDQVMPGLTGLELARDLKRVRPGVPVILCTGFSEAVTDAALAEAGVAECLMKPLNLREMADAIRRALGADAGAGPRGRQ